MDDRSNMASEWPEKNESYLNKQSGVQPAVPSAPSTQAIGNAPYPQTDQPTAYSTAASYNQPGGVGYQTMPPPAPAAANPQAADPSAASYNQPGGVGYQTMPPPSPAAAYPQAADPSSILPLPQTGAPPEAAPPSYEYVTQTGMAQMEQGLPPVHHSPPQVERTDNSCADCCKCFFSLIGHVGFFVCLIFLIVEAVSPSRSYDIIMPVCGAFLGVSYVIILIESCCSNTRKYLQHFLDMEGLQQHLSKVKNTRPTITWHVACYHYETRYRTVSSTDSNGHTTYRTESYQERVTTHRDSRQYLFNHWRDISPELPSFRRGVATRIEFAKMYTMMDEITTGNYHANKDGFYNENRHRDTYMDFTETFQVDGFEKHITAYVDDSAKKCCMEEHWFCITTMFLLGPFYRCWFKSATAKTHYTYVKELGI